MAKASKIQRFSFKGRILSDGLREALACSEDPILCVVRRRVIIFAVLCGARLVVSWRFRLPTTVDGAIVFVVPHIIANHLVATPPRGDERVDLVLRGDEARLTAFDDKGTYELHWQSDLRSFPAPPEMSRMLSLPSDLIQLRRVDLGASVHRSMVKLGNMESQQHIHRTKLAILLALSRGHLTMNGQEIAARSTDEFYFDPRLMVRALEFIGAEWIGIGLTRLSPRRAILSFVDKQPHCTLHCALLSIGTDTQRLFPIPQALRR